MSSSARLPLTTLVGGISFLMILTVLHILRPDHNPISRFISEYAIGAYGWLFSVGLIILGLSSLGLSAALFRSGHSRRVPIAVGIWGIGTTIAGIFPTDLQDAPITLSGGIHGIAAIIAFLSIVAAGLMLPAHIQRWQGLIRFMRVFGLVLLAALIVFFVSPLAIKGITERVFVVLVVLWLMIVARQMSRD